MVGFRDIGLPLPASAAEPFLLDLCKRCLSRNPQQRPTFPDIVAQVTLLSGNSDPCPGGRWLGACPLTCIHILLRSQKLSH